MSIFGKEGEVKLEEANATIATQKEKILELTSTVANYELRDSLVEAGSKIGFTGKIDSIMEEGVTYESGMKAMIASLEEQTEEEVDAFQESASEEAEEGTNDDEFVAKTQQDAINFVKNEHGLEGKEAVLEAANLFPKLFTEE